MSTPSIRFTDRIVRFALAFGLASVIACATRSVPASAKSTPEPGGANQIAGIDASLHAASVFNGQVRIRKMRLTKINQSLDEAYPDGDGKRWIVFRAMMSNGTTKPSDIEQFSATIVDADGISIAAQPDKVRPVGMVTNIAPGGAWRESILFEIPSDFKPVKIVLVPGAAHVKAVRIAIVSEDVPAP